MPITESNSPWIKASERPPEKEGWYVTVSEFTGETNFCVPDDCSGTYFKNGVWNNLKNWHVIEWLDEEKLSSILAELEAKDQRIAELEGLVKECIDTSKNATQQMLESYRKKL